MNDLQTKVLSLYYLHLFHPLAAVFQITVTCVKERIVGREKNR